MNFNAAAPIYLAGIVLSIALGALNMIIGSQQQQNGGKSPQPIVVVVPTTTATTPNNSRVIDIPSSYSLQPQPVVGEKKPKFPEIIRIISGTVVAIIAVATAWKLLN